MGSKKIRPVTPGMRGQVSTDFKDITKKKPEKSLLQSKKSSGGRNNKGRITSRHRGGGHKQKYRVVDFKRVKDGIPARVAGIEYDPNRNARIALLHYKDGEKAYIIAPDGIGVDAIVESGSINLVFATGHLPIDDVAFAHFFCSAVHLICMKQNVAH